MTQQGLFKENLEERSKTKIALLVSPIPFPSFKLLILNALLLRALVVIDP
jgi:hypothetical protein